MKEKEYLYPVAESQKNNNDVENGLEEAFYPWQCISIYRKDSSTLDLQIEDTDVVLCLLHVLHEKTYDN